jgi:hypothetical protein
MTAASFLISLFLISLGLRRQDVPAKIPQCVSSRDERCLDPGIKKDWRERS